MPAKFRLLVLLVVALSVFGCDVGFTRLDGATMGTYFSIVHDDCEITLIELEEELAQLNDALSTYQGDSEISQFNGHGAGVAWSMSDYLSDTVTASKTIWEQTGGAFDPTIGPLVDLWGFGPKRVTDPPNDLDLSAIRKIVGMDRLQVQGSELAKSTPGLRLDLSAIAKGYAVDVLAGLLINRGCENYMVDIGGEIAVAGRNQEGALWRLGIEVPDASAIGQVQQVLELTDAAVATSGDYRNFRVFGEQRVDHVMDPRSLRPSENEVVSATVVHTQAMYADGYATAAMVLGVEAGMALADQVGFPLLLMTRSVGSYSKNQRNDPGNDPGNDETFNLHYNAAMATLLGLEYAN